MPPRSIALQVASIWKHFNFKNVSQAFLLGVGASLCFNPGTQAAETITLEYSGTQRTFSVENINTFARTGEAATPEIEEFFDQRPEARRIVQEIFDAEIVIPSSIVEFLERELSTSTGEFALIQINKLFEGSSTSPALGDIREAFSASLEDQRFTLVELIENLPDPEIYINLTNLEPIYNNARNFVERILPAIETAREFLQDIICECETRTTDSSDSRQSMTGDGDYRPVAATQVQDCPDQAEPILKVRSSQTSPATPIESTEPVESPTRLEASIPPQSSQRTLP